MVQRRSRAQRLGFGWVVATIAVFAGAVSHLAVSGHLPGPLPLAVVWALSGMICVALAGMRRPRLATATGVLLSQGALHWLLSLSGTSVTLSSRIPGVAAGGHSGHEGGVGSLSVHVAGHAHALTAPMMGLHLLAALLTFLAIRQGERAAAGLIRVGRLLWSRLTSLPRPALPAMPRPRPLGPSLPAPTPLSRLLLGGSGLRGPPALSC